MGGLLSTDASWRMKILEAVCDAHGWDFQAPVKDLPEGGARLPAVRQARPGAGAGPLPARARREHVQGERRGDHRQPRAPLSRDRVGLHQGRDREVHGHQAVPDLRREAAPTGDPRGHDRRQEHLGHRDDVDHRRAPVGDRARRDAQRPRACDRLPGRQGDRGAARVPRRRRSRLPDPRSDERDAVGRRGAADPPGDPDRHDADGRPVHPRRAVDRPPPARQREAHRDARRDCATSATPCSSSSTTRRRSGPPTGSSTSAREPASTAARSSRTARSTCCSPSRDRSPARILRGEREVPIPKTRRKGKRQDAAGDAAPASTTCARST